MKSLLKAFLCISQFFTLPMVLHAAADCTVSFGASGGSPFTATGTLQFSNRGKQCYDWRISYNSQGFSAISIEVDSAPDASGSPGAWTQFTTPEVSNPIQGVNPNTNTSFASTYFRGNPAWIRVNLTTATGAGSISGVLYGCQEPGCGSGMAASTSAATPGTVTSVTSGNFSPLFNVTVATPTTTPAFSFAAISESANVVYAGPTSGGPLAPTFRALVAGDVPALSYTTSFSTGGLSPLFTASVATPASTPALSFALV